MFPRVRKTAATVAVASLLVTGAFLPGGPASGPLSHTPVAEAQTTTNIPATGNLHVHKRLGLPADNATPHNGTEVTNPPGTAVEGVKFTVYRVNGADGVALDLTTQDGWKAAQGVKLSDVYANGKTVDGRVGNGVDGTTNADGTADFSGLAAGLYLVVEQDHPVDKDGNALAPAAPFLVTVPMTNPESTGWLSDVHVYPKNQAVGNPVKTMYDPDVTQPGSSVGEQIGYQITSTIPQITPGSSFNGYMVSDKLPSGLGEPTATVTLDGTTLSAGTDYTLTKYQVGTPAQWVVRVELIGDALQSLNTKAGKDLVVKLESTVESAPTSGALENSAWVLPDNPGTLPSDWDPSNPGNNPPGNQSNTPRAVYGKVTVQKTNKDNEKLNGATFELHRCDADGKVADTFKDAIRVGGQTSFTTAGDGDNAGQAVIDGIHLVNQKTDGTTPQTEDVWAGKGTTFCLVETKAPDGYELLPAPFPVTISANGNETTPVSITPNVENVKKNAGFNLPLTGGAGIWFLIGGGILVLLIAAVYYSKTRRSANSEA